MNENMKRAKDVLTHSTYTLVLYYEKEIIRSDKRGIAPLLDLYHSGRDFSAFSAADKVVGKAAAFMYVLLGVRSIYAACISKPAIDVLRTAGITFEYDQCVDRIVSRDGKGLCPMESAVMNIESPHDAYDAVVQRLRELSEKKTSIV